MDDQPMSEKAISSLISQTNDNLRRINNLTNRLTGIINRIEAPEPSPKGEMKEAELPKSSTLTDYVKELEKLSNRFGDDLEKQVARLDRLV